MESKHKKPQPIYSDSFKPGIVRRVANGELPKEQARIEFGIGGNSSILEWIKKSALMIQDGSNFHPTPTGAQDISL